MDDSRREHHRVPLQVEVTMVSENNFYAGLTDNISEGGIFVATYMPPAVGTQVQFMLMLPDHDRSWLIHGVVRWIRSVDASCDGMPPGCGLQWEALPEEALHTIREFVAARDTLFYEAA